MTPATLKSIFYNAHPGDTLQLVGVFDNIRLQNKSFAKVVTLDASKAIFTDTLILQRDTGVKLSGGTFRIAGGSSYGKGVAIWGGSNISLNGTTVFGNGGEVGVSFEGTTNASIANGKFDGLRAAIGLESVTAGSATGNHITHAIADGIDIGDSHGVIASENSCSAGAPGPSVHPDCIQLWSIKGRPVQSDIIVTRNTAIGPTQGFTSFSGGGGALRVSITHNSVTSSFPQGIACYDCVDSTISYNTVSTLPGADHLTNIHVIGGRGNSVIDNKIIPRPAAVRKSATVARAAAFAPVAAFATVTAFPAATGNHNSALAVVDHNGSVNAVPEPATWVMLVAGFAAVGIARRRGTSREVGQGISRAA